MGDSTSLRAELEYALRDEIDSRQRFHDARMKVADVLRKLREAGVQSTAIARWYAQVTGQPIDVQSRRRIASSLRQRTSRATRRHDILGAAPCPELGAGPESRHHHRKEGSVPNDREQNPWIKRTTTVTEEILKRPPGDARDRDDDDLDDPEDDDERSPRRRR